MLVSRDNDKRSFDYEVTCNNIDILKNSKYADGNKLKLTILDTPDFINTQFGSRYFAAD